MVLAKVHVFRYNWALNKAPPHQWIDQSRPKIQVLQYSEPVK